MWTTMVINACTQVMKDNRATKNNFDLRITKSYESDVKLGCEKKLFRSEVIK